MKILLEIDASVQNVLETLGLIIITQHQISPPLF